MSEEKKSMHGRKKIELIRANLKVRNN